MAFLSMTRAQIRTKMRQLLGATDPSKGGPIDSDFDAPIDQGLNRFAVKSRALSSVFKLSTKANDKYMPLVDQILWPKTVSFIGSDGLRQPLDEVEVAPTPGSLGQRPRVWWLTAVNVPDITGPSVRTIGIDPYVAIDGSGNVIVEAIQMPQTYSGDTSVAEIHASMHPYIAYFAAIEMVGLFPERADRVPYWEARCAEGLDLFRTLCRGDAEQPYTFHDAMGYRGRYRTRV